MSATFRYTPVFILCIYYVVTVALLPAVLRIFPTISGEVIRKIRHVNASLSIFILLELFDTWHFAVSVIVVLLIIVYLFFHWLERQPRLIVLLADRDDSGKDLRKQAMLALTVFAVLIVFFQGVLGNDLRYIIAASVLTWGFGDAVAAVIGKRFGKTRPQLRFVDGSKTLEGTVAMIGMSTMVMFLVLFFYGPLNSYWSLIASIIISPMAATVELITRRGFDTITVPLTVAALLWTFVQVLTMLGWH